MPFNPGDPFQRREREQMLDTRPWNQRIANPDMSMDPRGEVRSLPSGVDSRMPHYTPDMIVGQQQRGAVWDHDGRQMGGHMQSGMEPRPQVPAGNNSMQSMMRDLRSDGNRSPQWGQPSGSMDYDKIENELFAPTGRQ